MELFVYPMIIYVSHLCRKEISVIQRDHQVPNIKISNVINSGPPVHQLERVQGATISLFTSTNAEQMSFPTFFPHGQMVTRLLETHLPVH